LALASLSESQEPAKSGASLGELIATVDIFDRQFAALVGPRPFSWQRRLFERLVKGDLPSALDLPTGLGKTSVMAIWLIARAHEAKLSRRLIYVVDRRAVVDQATTEAEKLREALEGKAEHFGLLDESTRAQATQTAAELKKRLGFSEKRKIPISTLRGVHIDNREWLDDPAAPAIIVGTIDMIGSRLLFSGYGVSRKMRPYHAGLLGADALVVLDEAHLVPPFERLLEAIETGGRDFGPRPEGDPKVIPPFRLLSLSATGRQREGEIIRLDDADSSDEIVAKRLRAPKALELAEAGDQKLEDALADQAWRLANNGAANIRCLIYCDSRETAEATDKAIKKLADGDRKKGIPKISIETELFVGARRAKERDDAQKWLRCHGFLAGSDAQRERPTFLIATSAGEVGVDLDADHMVCDLVPWERMVQRLGRVNRRGEGDASVVVINSGEPKLKKPDEPTPREMRDIVAHRSLTVIAELPNKDGRFDGSPGALHQLAESARKDAALMARIHAATTPEPLRPALNHALVDAWSMTSLETHTGRPDVAPWLRGWVEEVPQTIVVWRKYVPLRIGESGQATFSSKKEINEFFDAASPHESEKLETETHRVAEWLYDRGETLLQRKRRKANVEPVGSELPADEADGSGAVAQRIGELQRDDIAALILSPNAEYERHLTLSDLAQDRKGRAREDFHEILAGKILVIDARLGGLAPDGLLNEEADSDPPTADASNDWSKTAKFRVRLATSDDYESREEDWRLEDNFVRRNDSDGDPVEWLVVEHFKDASQSEEGRSISWPQELAVHQSMAARKMLDIAVRVGLSGIAAEALALAAFLHDEGKRAPNWQRAFRAPREKDDAGAHKVFAKTGGPIDRAILDGYRHEFGSLAIFEPGNDWVKHLPAEIRKRIDDLPQDWRDLVLHLIAAHHGRARPVIATNGCEDAPPSALKDRARDVALRFAKLQKRWGPWGLAWWEALLRAADQQASRDNEDGEGSSVSNREAGSGASARPR
jgi:CRISPR-associated endonuclease/helicase Cas3